MRRVDDDDSPVHRCANAACSTCFLYGEQSPEWEAQVRAMAQADPAWQRWWASRPRAVVEAAS